MKLTPDRLDRWLLIEDNEAQYLALHMAFTWPRYDARAATHDSIMKLRKELASEYTDMTLERLIETLERHPAHERDIRRFIEGLERDEYEAFTWLMYDRAFRDIRLPRRLTIQEAADAIRRQTRATVIRYKLFEECDIPDSFLHMLALLSVFPTLKENPERLVAAINTMINVLRNAYMPDEEAFSIAGRVRLYQWRLFRECALKKFGWVRVLERILGGELQRMHQQARERTLLDFSHLRRTCGCAGAE